MNPTIIAEGTEPDLDAEDALDEGASGDPAKSTLFSEQHEGQARFAYQLAERHADKIKSVDQVGWYAYESGRWVRDSNVPTQLLLELLRNARSEPRVDSDALREIGQMEKASAVNGILSLAAKLPELLCSVEELDADPYVLNCPNGTVDLRTGVLRRHDWADLITKQTRAAYKPNATGAEFERFLETSIPNKSKRDYLARFYGYSLLGIVLEHVLLLLLGKGRNGKGVLVAAIDHALGDYAGTGDPELFLARQGGHPTTEMALLGKRLITVSETGQGATLAGATLKKLVGGDQITARYMRKDFVTFKPSHSAVLVTNHLPKVRGDDPALWARLKLVKFDVVITPDQQDKHLPESLADESDAVLAWCVRGLQDYLRHGLAEPEAVTGATDEYRLSEDAVSQFLDQTCEKAHEAKTQFAFIYPAWVKFAERSGEPSQTRGEFKASLEARGVAVNRGTGNKVYAFGYRLTASSAAPIKRPKDEP